VFFFVLLNAAFDEKLVLAIQCSFFAPGDYNSFFMGGFIYS